MKKFVLALLLLALLSAYVPALTVEPTMNFNCSRCLRDYTFTFDNSYSADASGHMPVYRCPNCSLTMPALFHKAVHTGGAATCAAPGRCIVCDYPYIPSLAHDYSDIVSYISNLTHGRKCRNAGCNAAADVAPCEIRVTWNWSDPVNPCCDIECEQCGSIDSVVKHNTTPVTRAATCELPQRNVYTATVDFAGLTFTDTHTETVGAPLGHDFKPAGAVAATCMTDGYTLEKCSRCDKTRRAGVIEAPGHYYSQWSYDGEGTHSAVCLRCEESAARECTEGEYCLVCGSGEYEFVEGAFATGETLPERGELCVRNAPEKGYLISWEYNGKIEPLTAPLTVSVPTAPDAFITFTVDAEGLYSIEK